MKEVSIIGAGLAGLLAGAMLRRQCRIYEAAPNLPNNHHAVLRFRSDEISNHLGIPFKAVDVMKIVKQHRNKVADAVSYSIKSNGTASLRSIKGAEGKIDRRYIAPSDFVSRLGDMQSNDIEFGQRIDLEQIDIMARKGPVISTIPMPVLAKMLDYHFTDPVEFGSREGWVVKGSVGIPTDICASIYHPDPSVPITRASFTGDTFQIELVSHFDQAEWDVDRITRLALEDFGFLPHCQSYSAEMVRQRYAKILPIDDRERRKFIMWATDEFGIYSIGRFAIWKPGLLLDDVFHDIRRVQDMIRNGHNYEGRIK